MRILWFYRGFIMSSCDRYNSTTINLVRREQGLWQKATDGGNNYRDDSDRIINRNHYHRTEFTQLKPAFDKLAPHSSGYLILRKYLLVEVDIVKVAGGALRVDPVGVVLKPNLLKRVGLDLSVSTGCSPQIHFSH